MCTAECFSIYDMIFSPSGPHLVQPQTSLRFGEGSGKQLARIVPLVQAQEMDEENQSEMHRETHERPQRTAQTLRQLRHLKPQALTRSPGLVKSHEPGKAGTFWEFLKSHHAITGQ